MPNDFQFNIKYPHNTETVEEVLEYDTLVPFVDENNVVTHYYNPENNTIISGTQVNITDQSLGPTEYQNEIEIIIDQDSITSINLNNVLENNIDPLFKTIDLNLDPNMKIPTTSTSTYKTKPVQPIKMDFSYNNTMLLSILAIIFLCSIIILIYNGCENGWFNRGNKEITNKISKLVKRGRK